MPLGEEGRAHLRAGLRNGLSFARSATHLATGPVLAVTGSPIDAARSRRFAEGGVPGDNVAALDKFITARWPDGHLIVEMALAHPSDPWLATTDLPFITCHDEVYALTLLRAARDERRDVIAATDPASLYVAAVVSASDGMPPRCPPEDLGAGRLTVHCLATGAYDGEGYVLCLVG